MIQVQLQTGFDTWRHAAALDGNQMRLVGGALNRMRNLKMSQAWEQWQHVYIETRRQLALLLRASMKMLRMSLARAFCAWREGAGLSGVL